MKAAIVCLFLPLGAAAQPVAAPAAPPDEALDNITILGTPVELARMGGSAHLVDEAALEAFEYDDAQRILQTVPGTYVRDEDGFGLRPNIGLRGTSTERSAKVTLMEDGVLFAPAPYAAPAAYFFPLMARMTGVEVFKGPAAIKYGPNTIGGAINFVSRPIPRGSAGALDLSLGQYFTGKAQGHYGFGGERVGALLEGVRLQSDGFKHLDGGGDTGFVKHEALAKLRFNTDPRASVYHRLDLKLGYADETSNETYLGLNPTDFAADPYRRYAASALGLMQWTRTQLQAAYTFEVDELTLRLTAYRHDFERTWRKLDDFADGSGLPGLLNQAAPSGPDAVKLAVLRGEADTTSTATTLLVGTNARTYLSQGVQLAGDWSATGATLSHDVQVGARLHADEIVRDHRERPYAMRSGDLEAAGASADTVQNRGSAVALSGYALYELGLARTVFLTPGLRVEHVRTRLEDFTADTRDDNALTVLLPGLGVFWQATEAWGLLAGVHRGFSPLAPGQPDEIEPETAINYEAGARFGYERVSGELIGFLSDYQNLTAECTLSTGCDPAQVGRQYNGGAVLVYGLEALLRQNHPLFAGVEAQLDLSYTLTLSEFRTAFISDNPQLGDVEVGDALPYLPEHQGAVKAGFTGPTWAVHVGLTYTGEMRDRAGQGAIPDDALIPDRWVMDLLARKALGRFGAIYGKIDNFTQNESVVSRRPAGARPAKPFLAMVGYTYEFED